MAGNWSPERIFLEYFEAKMTEIGRIPKAQMKLRILIKETVYFPSVVRPGHLTGFWVTVRPRGDTFR